MDTADIKIKYDNQSIISKITLMFLIGILPALYVYFEDLPILEEELKNTKSNKMLLESKFKQTEEKAKKLPEMEKKIQKIRDELKIVKQKLPDKIMIDRLLEKVTLISNSSGVDIQFFKPGNAYAKGKGYKYAKIPIFLELKGSYGQIAVFFDKVMNLESLIYIENINLLPSISNELNLNSRNQNLTEKQLFNQKIENLFINATAELVVFRSLTPEESLSVSSQETKKK